MLMFALVIVNGSMTGEKPPPVLGGVIVPPPVAGTVAAGTEIVALPAEYISISARRSAETEIPAA